MSEGYPLSEESKPTLGPVDHALQSHGWLDAPRIKLDQRFYKSFYSCKVYDLFFS